MTLVKVERNETKNVFMSVFMLLVVWCAYYFVNIVKEFKAILATHHSQVFTHAPNGLFTTDEWMFFVCYTFPSFCVTLPLAMGLWGYIHLVWFCSICLCILRSTGFRKMIKTFFIWVCKGNINITIYIWYYYYY